MGPISTLLNNEDLRSSACPAPRMPPTFPATHRAQYLGLVSRNRLARYLNSLRPFSGPGPMGTVKRSSRSIAPNQALTKST